MISEAELEKLVARATELGKEAGHDAAMWVEISGVRAARRLVVMSDDGDPAFDEAVGYRSPLTGEWADEVTERDLFRELGDPTLDDFADQEIIDAYKQEHYDAFTEEIVRRANYLLS